MDYQKRAAVAYAPIIPEDLVREHAEWSLKTFGMDNVVGPVAPARHLSKEAIEFSEAWAAERGPEWIDNVVEEFADITFLFLDTLRRSGICQDMLIDGMRKKMAVLKSRTYDKIQNDQPSHHVRLRDQREGYGSPTVMASQEAAVASIKEFWNDLEGMSGEKMKRELNHVTTKIEEDEPWQEALTHALSYNLHMPECRKAFGQTHGLRVDEET